MAKVRCAKCGSIFPLQMSGIQVCPVCRCRMRIKISPETSKQPREDYFDVTKSGYLGLMRDKVSENKGGVNLSRDEYDVLVAKTKEVDRLTEEASEHERLLSEQAEAISKLSDEIERLKSTSSAPVAPDKGVCDKPDEIGETKSDVSASDEFVPMPVDPSEIESDVEMSESESDEDEQSFALAADDEEFDSEESSYTYDESEEDFADGEYDDEYGDNESFDEGSQSDGFETTPRSSLYETELTYQCFRSEQEVRKGKNKVCNWLTLIASGIAALCAVALLFLDVGTGSGLSLLVPETAWAGVVPFDPVFAVVFFFPMLAFITSFIGALCTGKVVKFFVGIMDIIGGLLIFETNVFTAMSEAWAKAEVYVVDFDAVIKTFTEPNLFLLIVAIVCVLAGILNFIFGALINKKRIKE